MYVRICKHPPPTTHGCLVGTLPYVGKKYCHTSTCNSTKHTLPIHRLIRKKWSGDKYILADSWISPSPPPTKPPAKMVFSRKDLLPRRIPVLVLLQRAARRWSQLCCLQTTPLPVYDRSDILGRVEEEQVQSCTCMQELSPWRNCKLV